MYSVIRNKHGGSRRRFLGESVSLQNKMFPITTLLKRSLVLTAMHKRNLLSFVKAETYVFLHQLNSKNDGLVLFFKTIFRH